jgi:2-polyprenyl-6-methoxyphenol hydroxylase-like FAD-dependent oxidoreductase
VVIVGGGIAGLATGIAFTNAGWDVIVLERAARIEPMGAALSLWSNACTAMARIGVLDAVYAGAARIRTMLLATQNEQAILSRALSDTAIISTRTNLQNSLLVALGSDRIRLNAVVDHVSANRVIMTSGETLTCDLVVDAGGIRAPSAAGPPARYSGYGGVLALSDRVAGPSLAGLAAEYWGKHERFGVFELPDDRRYWFYMRTQSADAAMPTLAKCAAVAEAWPPSVAQAIAATPANALFPFSVHAKPPPKSLSAPGIVRVGDAGHAMEPNLGQGACQGLEDAAALQAIAAAVPADKIGSHFERLRLKRAQMCVRESALGRLGAHGPGAVQAIMRMALMAFPSAVTEPRISAMQTMPDYESCML